MKIIFFGLGSIGKRHAGILLKKYKHNLYALRSGVGKRRNELGIQEINSWKEIENLQPDIAFITNPTAVHIKTALKCANLGCKLFIDKPIGDKLNGLYKLEEIVKQKKLVTYVGYNMRFHSVIQNLKKYFEKNKQSLPFSQSSKGKFLHMNVLTTSFLPNWRKGTDYKKSYRTNKGLGGGVILDLSHEFDFINYLLGDIKILSGQFSRRSDLTVDVEDYADVIIKSKLGPVNLHINFLSHKNQRIIQIDFEEVTVVGDLINSTIEEYKNERLISKKSFESERNYSFEKQLDYFFENIDNPNMMNNLLEASVLYEKIINFKKKHG